MADMSFQTLDDVRHLFRLMVEDMDIKSIVQLVKLLAEQDRRR